MLSQQPLHEKDIAGCTLVQHQLLRVPLPVELKLLDNIMVTKVSLILRLMTHLLFIETIVWPILRCVFIFYFKNIFRKFIIEREL